MKIFATKAKEFRKRKFATKTKAERSSKNARKEVCHEDAKVLRGTKRGKEIQKLQENLSPRRH